MGHLAGIDTETLKATRAVAEAVASRYDNPLRQSRTQLASSRERCGRGRAAARLAGPVRGDEAGNGGHRLRGAAGYRLRIQQLPIWEEEWAHPEAYSNPRLLRNIEREGVRL